jgi:hypothetical protein
MLARSVSFLPCWQQQQQLTNGLYDVVCDRYDPSKLDGLQKIMKKYTGAEEQLFGLLTKKYGPEPKPGDEAAAAAAATAAAAAAAAAAEDEEEDEEEDEDGSEDGDGRVVQPNVAPGRGKAGRGGGGGGDAEAAAEGGFAAAAKGAVVYCGACGLPPEYCEWGSGEPAVCKVLTTIKRCATREQVPRVGPSASGPKPTHLGR